jgi:DNA-binding HxlR family transcriptional regulator
MSEFETIPDPFSSKVRRGEVLDPDCPSRDVLKHMTSRWGVLVLVVLIGGTHRFSELRRKIVGISEKMLSQTLQGLEGDGLVHRHSRPLVPPYVEYTLTPLGSVRKVLSQAPHSAGQ